ncbi:MAG TPA: DUF4230 domain-containing protein [Micromonosporaceae bacterium]|jgi:hypothetical protein
MSTQPSGTGAEPNVVVIKERGGWFGKLLVTVGFLGVLGAVYLGLGAIHLLPSFIKNPFETTTTEHSGPVLVESIRDANQFLAAEGTFQVVVDREDSLRILGVNVGWASGCRAVFVGYGDVNAQVDVSGLTEDAIQISADGQAVTITLPEPQLSDVDPDVTESYVLAQQEGIWQRIQGFFSGGTGCPSELELVQAAEGKISEAAKQSDLVQRAEQNTRTWLEGMAHSLGYERVTVNFTPNPQ